MPQNQNKTRKILCKLGFHKLIYMKKYLITSGLKCKYCGAEFLEGLMMDLYKK